MVDVSYWKKVPGRLKNASDLDVVKVLKEIKTKEVSADIIFQTKLNFIIGNLQQKFPLAKEIVAKWAKLKGGKRRDVIPTVSQMKADKLSALADNWNGKSEGSFKPELVDNIYTQVKKKHYSRNKVMVLEFSLYFEKYLWKNFTDESSDAHIMSMIMMMNEKFRENVPAWDICEPREKFGRFWFRVLHLSSAKGQTMAERTMIIQFLIHCFQSLEQDFLRALALKLTSLPSWYHLNDLHRQRILSDNLKLQTLWAKKISKKYSNPSTPQQKLERDFIADLLETYLLDLERIGAKETIPRDEMVYLERFVEFVLDLVTQLPTRRWVRPLLVDKHFGVRCRLSQVASKHKSRCFVQLLDSLKFYEGFEINDQTASSLTTQQMNEAHYEKLQALQRLCYTDHRERLEGLALANISSLDTRAAIETNFKDLPLEILVDICAKICYLDARVDPVLAELLKIVEQKEAEIEKLLSGLSDKKKRKRRREIPKSEEEQRLRLLFVEIFIDRFERRESQMENINLMPLFPTEELIWDANKVPDQRYDGEYSVVLPKLNLQFLTIHDYLLRNFNLFRLESTYEIRENIHDTVRRMAARQDEYKTYFTGRARMGIPITSFSVVTVKNPEVGEIVPSEVRAEITFSLAGILPNIREEWDQLREHDVLFPMFIQAPPNDADKNITKFEEFPETFGVSLVRGCEAIELLDEEGNCVSEPNPQLKKNPVGNLRTLRVFLDPAQYQLDLQSGKLAHYDGLNLLMRRKPKENNFKAVLETIRSLMNNQAETVIPDWMHDLFLGYGAPNSAQYSQLSTNLTDIDFRDTFLDKQHLLASFPDHEIECPEHLQPPFKLKFSNDQEQKKVSVETYPVPDYGPYEHCKPRLNTIQFTNKQCEAIRSGVNPGLTMVVGPPGTGKTDTAVQMINLIYHNFPDQKMLLVAHSNQALNDLFEKIIALDIPERYLLRMGYAAKSLETDKDFSKWGRVNYMLQRRLDLLTQVEKLALSVGVTGADVAYTCETAQHFNMLHVAPKWQQFKKALKLAERDGSNLAKALPRPKRRRNTIAKAAKKARLEHEPEVDTESEEENEHLDDGDKTWEELSQAERAKQLLAQGSVVAALFPFTKFFNDLDTLFTGDYDLDMRKAESCWRYIEILFQDVEECLPFELLRNQHDRSNYLLTKQARIIAMTCTHAALQRKNLVKLAFKYDNLIMEESAQVLEVETFIPMLLQKTDRGNTRLKRIVLIGDHNQLPPVVKNQAFQKYAHFDQSLFARFVRLKIPTVDLDFQGRARPTIADLYNWRYKGLGNLPNVLQQPQYQRANGGLSYEYQFVDVKDFDGKGEMVPQPFFFQNLGEAEYCVALFMYLRLSGVPAHKISILSTYRGQKHLIRDVIRQRCAWNPLFGEPAKITTVDKFQGQQNDYILVSLVRTTHVGHVRDVRRLVVAMSRARLGLYVFGRLNIFENCWELAPVFKQFVKRPVKLCLEFGESSPTERLVSNTGTPSVVNDVKHMWEVLQVLIQTKAQEQVQIIQDAMPQQTESFPDQAVVEEYWEEPNALEHMEEEAPEMNVEEEEYPEEEEVEQPEEVATEEAAPEDAVAPEEVATEEAAPEAMEVDPPTEVAEQPETMEVEQPAGTEE